MMDLASRLHAAEEAGSQFSDAELVGLVQTLPDGSARREEACETLVARYQPVIRSCVRRYRGLRELDDELMQVGYLGLMKAIRNFDPEIGSSLPAYVRPCVSGEIKRYFRDRRWTVRVQRPVQELRLEIREATGPLTQELARAPEPAELAQRLHVSEEQITEAQTADRAFQATSLDAPVSAEEGAATIADLLGEDDPRIEQAVDLESVRVHWDELDDQAQELLTLRFYGNMTQSEIGNRLGVSQMQVSRLLRRALGFLRWRLTGSGADGAPPPVPAEGGAG
jgi:RNA polymerase sigma-B factor